VGTAGGGAPAAVPRAGIPRAAGPSPPAVRRGAAAVLRQAPMPEAATELYDLSVDAPQPWALCGPTLGALRVQDVRARLAEA